MPVSDSVSRIEKRTGLTTLRKTLYFGNTTPLLVTLLLLGMITVGVPGSPLLWAQPFRLTFIAGVCTDA